MTLHLEDLWISNITLTTGLVNGTTVATLLDLMAHGKLDARAFGTHSFQLDQMVDAYDVFGTCGHPRRLEGGHLQMRTPNATASPRSRNSPPRCAGGRVVMAGLDTVIDPELEEPITDLGFRPFGHGRRSGVAVHLHLPATHRSPNVPYLIASDALDALRDIDDLGDVRVMLDDHHDSERTFLRKAHTAAMQRCVAALPRDRTLDDTALQRLTLRDLPDNKKEKWARNAGGSTSG